jgi:hypothetical protein
MVALARADLEKALRVVQMVGASRDPNEFSRVVVSQLAALVPSDVAALNEVAVTGRTIYVAEPSSFVVPPELEHHSRQHHDSADFFYTGG